MFKPSKKYPSRDTIHLKLYLDGPAGACALQCRRRSGPPPPPRWGPGRRPRSRGTRPRPPRRPCQPPPKQITRDNHYYHFNYLSS
jgi:hypothetical protein